MSASADRADGLPPGFEAVGPPLGAGATAVVWPARRTLDGREFALKVWRRPFADELERERFRREVRQHATLDELSGHVVTYTWADEEPTSGTPWIGTQRHGASLQDLLERGRPPLAQAVVLCADLLAGLADMHEHGVLHRDVKPGNVLAEDGRAKLCDLGLVMDSACYTEDNAAGTPRYVAPELFSGTARPSARSDVCSAARTVQEVLGPDVPEPLAQLLTEAASANPADRPPDAGAFDARFWQACAALGLRLPPPLPARRGNVDHHGADQQPPPGAHHPRGRWGVAAAAVLLVGLGAVLLTDRAGDSASPVASPRAERPDAGLALPDIAPDGRPVVLETTRAGRCQVVLEGAQQTGEHPYRVGGTLHAVVRTYYDAQRQQACAKLIKPEGSPHVDEKTHLALTLCGDANACDSDWSAYSIDAGPAVVPSRDGCVSWRVSFMDADDQWLVRDDVQSSGCT